MSDLTSDPFVEIPDTDTQSSLALIDATPEGVATVTINRADKKNAFNAEVIGALREAFETLKGAEGVRIVFLEGAGETSLTQPGAAISAARTVGFTQPGTTAAFPAFLTTRSRVRLLARTSTLLSLASRWPFSKSASLDRCWAITTFVGVRKMWPHAAEAN